MAGVQWLTSTELHGYIKDTHGVNVQNLIQPHMTLQAWAKKHNVRRREFNFARLTPKVQQERVTRVTESSYRTYQKPATVLQRCRYEFNVSDVRRLVRQFAARQLQKA